MLPVDRTSKDPFYRYMMPPVIVAQESSKTVIYNLDQIAKSIYRNPSHIVKYLSITFGCTCIVSNKFALNGSFDHSRIQNGIFDYIDTFVLCKECRNPETRFVYGLVLKRTCSSCGATFIQENHKLNQTIMKDKDKAVNEDTKYEINNKSNLSSMIKEECDNSQSIYDHYKKEGLSLETLFEDYIKPKDLKQLRLVLAEATLDSILENIENMLEAHKKEDKIESTIKALVKLDFSIDEISEYFSHPRKNKKRSPLIKKNVETYLQSLDE